ncbi:MAG: SDR family oxidoreductase [Nanoarchaeota archaeon]|nr:SDR family oxidoreductase [Nanoarchaeota archaeon]
MAYDLKDEVVVIAGGAGLIGKALSKAFAEEGAKVVIASKEGKGFAQEIGAGFHELDISDESSVDRLIKDMDKGHGKIDVFINCAWPKTDDWMTNVEEVKFKSILKNLEMHLGGYWLCCQRFALYMKKQGHGRIINFSSTQGVVAPNFSVYEGTKMTSPPAYPLIKGGIIMMTKYFATYFAKHNVRVNSVSPGGVYNDQDPDFVKRYSKLTPLGRMAKAEEIVSPVLMLASKKSSYMTGENIMVDGGWTTW